MDEVIIEKRKKYKSLGIPTILDDGLKVLLDAVKKHKPTNILEVGTATGMSGIAMLQVCPSAKLTTIEILESSFLEAQKNFAEFGFSSNVTQKLGDSLEVLKNIEGEFDFVFLDGSKSKYLQCLKLIEPHLKNGAVVVADNVYFRGYIESDCPRRYKTIKKRMLEFLEYINTNQNYFSETFREGDGVSISIYKKN